MEFEQDTLMRLNPVLNERYKLIQRIGSGGMAAVYKAQDLVLGRMVAIKVLHQAMCGDEGFLERFRKEAYAVANLSHPNIVTVHDIGQHEFWHYIVMEFVEGTNLKQIIRRHNERGELMPISRALDFAVQICAGVGYAHRAGLVHCDVKPQNMLVTRDDRIKVTDFGIARAMSEASQQTAELVWGTPQYFSPEQASGRPATPASDVYSTGIILFEMLTGQLPFMAESHTALALKHVRELPPTVTDINPAVPVTLAEVVDKVLAKEPASRYSTGGQFGRILSTYRNRSQADTHRGLRSVEPIPADGVTQPYVRPVSAERYAPPHDATPQRPTARAQYEPTTYPPPAQPVAPPEPYVEQPVDETDWIAIGLGVVALIALLGLIPLWYVVYLSFSG